MSMARLSSQGVGRSVQINFLIRLQASPGIGTAIRGVFIVSILNIARFTWFRRLEGRRVMVFRGG